MYCEGAPAKPAGMNTAPRTESIQRHADTDAAIRTVPNGKRAPTTREGRIVGCVPTLPNERHELELRRASNITIHTLGAPTQKLSRSLLPAAAATVSHPHRAGTAHSARRGRTAPARPRRTAHPCGHLFLSVRSPPFLLVRSSLEIMQSTAIVALALLESASAFTAPTTPMRSVSRASATMFSEGDLGVLPPLGVFDPLGLIETRDMRRYEIMEIKHGRAAMLGFLVVITTESGLRFPGYLSPSADLKFADMPGGALASWAALPGAGWLQIMITTCMMETGHTKTDVEASWLR